MIKITTLNIKTKTIETTITLVKNNSVLILNKTKFFEFFQYFYQVLKYKEKSIQIKIDNKILDNKNTILLSFCDFTEILGNLEWKKGTLFYEYMTARILESSFLDNDILLYNIDNILKDIVAASNFDISYEIEDDISKILFNCSEFKLKYKFNELTEILSKFLNNIIKINPTKHFIIFYDSNLFDFDWNEYDYCYTFDISRNIDFNYYNLICDQELVEFNNQIIIDKLESIWPIEFNNKKIKEYIKEFFGKKISNSTLIAHNEHEYLTYIILNKLYNYKCIVKIDNFIISDNVKSFLAKI